MTFTNKAAREVADRLKRKLGDAAYGVRVGTFHSLACKVLRRWPGHAGLEGSDFRVVDEEDAKYLALLAAVQVGLVPAFEPPLREGITPADWEKKESEARGAWEARAERPVAEALRKITLWKIWGLNYKELEKPGRPLRPDLTEELQARMFVAYQHELSRRNAVDFADLVAKAARIMGYAEVRKAESASVQHLLIDEAQDVNSVQKKFAQALAATHGNIFAVGDEDQSIMGFQASLPDAMGVIAGEGARRFGLTINRRCTEQILKPAVEVVNWNRRKNEKRKLLTSGREGSAVELLAYPTEIREAHAVAERIREMLDAGVNPGEIAVLVRSGWTMEPFEEAFLRHRIPFNRVGGHSLLARDEFRDMIGYMRLAVAPRDDLAFRRIANRPSRGLGPAAIQTIVDAASARNLTYSEACFAVAASESVKLRMEVRENLVKLARILEWLAVDGTSGRQTALMLDAVLADTGYEEWIRRDGAKKASRRMKTMDFVRRVALEEDDAAAFAQAVALMTDLDEEADTDNSVRLSTIHSAKGLEFDHVFLPVWEMGIFPSERAVKDGVGGREGDSWNGPVGGGLPEERRLAHVALTRARKTVHVSYAMLRTTGKGGGPSSFVAEAGISFVDTVEGVGQQGKTSRRKAAAGRSGFARRAK